MDIKEQAIVALGSKIPDRLKQSHRPIHIEVYEYKPDLKIPEYTGTLEEQRLQEIQDIITKEYIDLYSTYYQSNEEI